MQVTRCFDLFCKLERVQLLSLFVLVAGLFGRLLAVSVLVAEKAILVVMAFVVVMAFGVAMALKIMMIGWA